MRKDKKEEPEKEHTEEELEELENLIRVLEELEDAKDEDDDQKKKPRNFIAIEFGGVFHRNRYIDFIFNFIFNFTLTFLLIEIFGFAMYDSITYIVLFVLLYTVLETIYKTYILMNYFHFIIKSLGFIFFIGYVLLFFALDQYVFVRTIDFINETLLVVFVGMFTIIRYVLSTLLRQNFRKRNLR